jgi:hypothetical protein
MSTDRIRDIFIASLLQTSCQGDCIFNCLCGSIPRCWQERVSRITNLNHPSSRTYPACLGIPPKKLEIDNCVVRRTCYQLPKNRSPLCGPRDQVHAGENLSRINCVRPVFLLAPSSLLGQFMLTAVKKSMTYIMVHDPNH